MKFIFKIILIISLNCYAGRVEIQYAKGRKNLALLAKSIFQKKYKIPNSLIRIHHNNKCESANEFVWLLCVTDTGELRDGPNVNRELIKSSLAIFYKGFKNDL